MSWAMLRIRFTYGGDDILSRRTAWRVHDTAKCGFCICTYWHESRVCAVSSVLEIDVCHGDSFTRNSVTAIQSHYLLWQGGSLDVFESDSCDLHFRRLWIKSVISIAELAEFERWVNVWLLISHYYPWFVCKVMLIDYDGIECILYGEVLECNVTCGQCWRLVHRLDSCPVCGVH